MILSSEQCLVFHIIMSVTVQLHKSVGWGNTICTKLYRQKKTLTKNLFPSSTGHTVYYICFCLSKPMTYHK